MVIGGEVDGGNDNDCFVANKKTDIIQYSVTDQTIHKHPLDG